MPHPLDDLLPGEQVPGPGEEEFEQISVAGLAISQQLDFSSNMWGYAPS